MENTSKKSRSSYQTYRIRLIQYSIALNNIKVSPYIIYILITIQALQLISMGTIEPLRFQSLGLSYFQYVSQVLYPDYYLRNTQLVLYLIPITFFITLFHFLIVLFTFHTQSRLKIIVLYFFLLFNTIILIPFLQANLSVLSCTPASPFSTNFTCYQGYHIVYLLLACLNILWAIFCTFFVFMLCTKNDPLSTDFYATSFNLWILARFLLKISPIIYINVDPNLKFGVLYSVSFAGINLVYFVAFKLMWPEHRNCEKISNFVISAQMMIIFVTAFLITLHFFKDDTMNVSFILSWILSIVFSQLVIQIFAFKKQRLIKIYIKNSNQQQQIDEQTYIKFFYTLIYKIQQTSIDQIQILHILKLHQLHCGSEECCCHEIEKIYQIWDKENKLNKELIYKFINCLMREASVKLRKNNVSLVIASAYVSYYKLNEKIISIHNLSQLLKSNKLSLAQEISIRRLFLDLKNMDKSLTDLNKYIEFSQNLWNFEREAEVAAQNCQKYWNYLIEQDCSTTKVWELANLVHSDKQRLENIVKTKLLSIFPNNLHTLRLYSELLTLIYRVPSDRIKQYSQIYEIASSQLTQNVKKEEDLLFRQNEEITVMCAAEFDGIFEFLRVSSNVINILSIRNVDLIHKNVNTIMPEIYQEFHDQKIKQYFNSNDRIIRQRKSKAFLIAKQGNVVSCFYKAKIVSSMDHGLELVCFLRKNNKDKNERSRNYYLIYYSKKGTQEEDGEFKNGDILHIEPELKNILFPPQNQKDETYVTKIEEVLPQWDIQHQIMIMTEGDNNLFNKIIKMEIEHEDQLDSEVTIKYLKIQIKKDKSRFTLEEIESTQFFQKTKKSQVSIKECAYAQTSQSRLITMEDNDKINSAHTNGLEEKPIPISKFVIYATALALAGAMIMLCVVPFKISPSYIQLQMQQFDMIEVISNLGFGIFEISLNIQKKKDNTFTNGKTFPKMGPQTLDILSERMKNIYDFLGIENVDSKIHILLKIYSNNALVQVLSQTINNAVSYLINTMSELLQDLNQESNLYLNLQQAYEGIRKLSTICGSLMSQKFKSIKIREIVCSSLQLFLILVLFVVSAVRSAKVSNFSMSTIKIYESSMDTFRLKDFVVRCKVFIEKIRGTENSCERITAEKLKLILMQFQHYIPSSNPKPVSSSDKQLEKVDEQQQKLINLKRKVNFHQGPSKGYYIILGFIVITGWVALKVALKFPTIFVQVEQMRFENRSQITNCFQLNSHLQRLAFHLALNQSSSEFERSLLEVQKALTSITDLGEAKQSISFQAVFKVLAQLKTKKTGINFTLIQQSLVKGQNQLVQYAHKLIKKQYQVTNSLRSPQFLAAQVIIGIVAIFSFWKLMIIQEQKRIGCTLMLEMVKEGLGNEECKEKNIKTSRIF